MTYQPKVYRKQGGNELVVADGGVINIESGGDIKVDGSSLIDEIAALSGLDSGELGVLNGVTPGTVAAEKAVVVDEDKDISVFRNVGVVNLDAGSSGVAGSVDVFPATASKGKLAILCDDQAGNTTVTLKAAEMAAARTITIPDPGGAADVVLTAGTQTIAGAKTFSGDNKLIVSTAAEDDQIAINLGVIGQVRRFHATITLATDGAETAVGLTPNGIVLAAAIRVSTEITGLDSDDHHIKLGVSGATNKYVDVAQGGAATTISVNKKGHYTGNPVGESAALILTIDGGADNTPSAGAVEVEVLYMARGNLADG